MVGEVAVLLLLPVHFRREVVEEEEEEEPQGLRRALLPLEVVSWAIPGSYPVS